jgi:hypothetical protein
VRAKESNKLVVIIMLALSLTPSFYIPEDHRGKENEIKLRCGNSLFLLALFSYEIMNFDHQKLFQPFSHLCTSRIT